MSAASEAFFTVHRDLPREGPGDPADVDWALTQVALPAGARICDAGCGPGADLEVFSDRLPKAQLEGVDGQAHFVAQAAARVPQARVWQGDMAAISGPYDLIWCAGALYFLGITAGLQGWRNALAPGGHVIFSEPLRLPGFSAEAEAFWADYPALTDLDGVVAQVTAAGFEVLSSRRIVGQPWANYYEPMAARIAALRPGADAALTAALDENALEIARWRAAPDQIVYELFVVRPA